MSWEPIGTRITLTLRLSEWRWARVEYLYAMQI